MYHHFGCLFGSEFVLLMKRYRHIELLWRTGWYTVEAKNKSVKSVYWSILAYYWCVGGHVDHLLHRSTKDMFELVWNSFFLSSFFFNLSWKWNWKGSQICRGLAWTFCRSPGSPCSPVFSKALADLFIQPLTKWNSMLKCLHWFSKRLSNRS